MVHFRALARFRNVWSMRVRAAASPILLAAALGTLTGCGLFGEKTHPRCGHPVVLVEDKSAVRRRHVTLGRLSASCNRARDCGVELRAGACALHADAVILDPLAMDYDPRSPVPIAPGPALPEGKNAPREQPGELSPARRATRHTQAGTAVRWTEPGAGAYPAQR